MIDMATSFEFMPVIFLLLLFSVGALPFTIYGAITWHTKRKNRRKSTPPEIKWQRRIEAIREMETE